MSPRTPSAISSTDAPRGLFDKTATIASRTSPGRRRVLLFRFDRFGIGRSLRRLDVSVNRNRAEPQRHQERRRFWESSSCKRTVPSDLRPTHPTRTGTIPRLKRLVVGGTRIGLRLLKLEAVWLRFAQRRKDPRRRKVGIRKRLAIPLAAGLQ
jgi:hypothetical protein